MERLEVIPADTDDAMNRAAAVTKHARTGADAQSFGQPTCNLAYPFDAQLAAIHRRIARHQKFTATPLAFDLLHQPLLRWLVAVGH